MSAETGSPAQQEPCPGCQELRLAEALANDRHDYSEATDCRVLLRRHRDAADCTEQRSA
ncbi:hypothetical protein [Streptomyces sp. NBC_00893]|uniref:hypothetical protein n=1 Tax=Streptomyces sp. NBC_00893 TaxID=2975862 RepID=UPI00224CB85A|nr:hypothetical protein [Streptomyces sp. NBC_00893]MCX4846909.1 hypothetical protein [Streptomyces sp. NBC_00893]